MNEEERKDYQKKYKDDKETSGIKFFPDIIFKDAIVSLSIFILLIGFAAFIGVAQEAPADPSDTNYIPRPEWYFLFIFEMLKFFPGVIGETIGAIILPATVITVLFLLPFIDKSPRRHYLRRPFLSVIAVATLIAMVFLHVRAVITTPEQEEAVAASWSEKVTQGEDLYLTYCTECHDPDGQASIIQGVEGLEGTELNAINSQDFLYTRTDETIYNIVDVGQPSLGMPPYGVAYGGELTKGEIETLVAFIRNWDDRVVVEEEETAAAALPAPDETPSYASHVYPILKKRCLSCHREGKAQQNYMVDSYEGTLNSGDHAPNIIPGDAENSMFIRMLYREETDAGGAMPPTKPLSDVEMDVLIRWIADGAPNN